MINPRFGRWLAFTILVLVFLSTLAPAQEATPQGQPPIHDLSPWGMFMAADIVVKSVMIGLAIASVLTWTVLVAKAIELSTAKRRVARALAMIDSAHSLADAAEHSRPAHGPVHGLVRAAVAEHGLWFVGMDKSGLRDRVESRLERLVAASSRRMTRGTGILATIGSTGPFVGLFGTVWGIMNSFIGISKSQTTNLAVVAPGIAEALLATAHGPRRRYSRRRDLQRFRPLDLRLQGPAAGCFG